MADRERLAPAQAPDDTTLHSTVQVLQERNAELEQWIVAEQTRARLALAALASTIELA